MKEMTEMTERRYSLETLFRLNSPETKFPGFGSFFVYYFSKCPRTLKHRKKNPADACIKCGHCSSEEWKYSEKGYEFYKLYFTFYDKIMIRKEIQGILNKIVEDTFDILSQDLIEVIKKVESRVQLSEAVLLLFDKALIEPNYMKLYASVCYKLSDVRVQEGNTHYMFETELLALLESRTECFPENERDKKKFLSTLHFTGHLYQKKINVEGFARRLIDKMFAFSDCNFVAEGLCKILPFMVTDNPGFRVQLDKFSRLKPTVSRIKFLMMDAMDSIKKASYKRKVLHQSWNSPLRWTTTISTQNRFGLK